MINCLNCYSEISSNFCPNCGQKATVHRYSVKHFVEHDLIHGIWHVDAGILKTIKTLFTTPGHAVREFIIGKRTKLFNYLSLLIIIIGVSHYIGSYSSVKMSELFAFAGKTSMNDFETFTKNYPKMVLLMTIPFYALATFFWFKRAKLNFTEHIVLNSYKAAGEFLITMLFTISTLFYTNKTGLLFIFSITSFFGYLYSFWFYNQFFSVYGYSKTSLNLKSIVSVISYFLVSFLIGIAFALIKQVKEI